MLVNESGYKKKSLGRIKEKKSKEKDSSPEWCKTNFKYIYILNYDFLGR